MRLYPDSPVAAALAIVQKADKLLLIQRANEPGRGQWAVPGGAVELGETTAEAARREALEECSVHIHVGQIIDTYDVIERDDDGRVRHHYVIVCHLAQHISGIPQAATDALTAHWVDVAQLPALDMPAKLKQVVLQAVGLRS